MVLYFAGNVLKYDPDYYAAGVRSRLLSYAFVDNWQSQAFEFWLKDPQPDGSRVFVDSGAFSAKSKGTEIDLSAYCDFLHERLALVDTYASLDVIGDWRGSAKNHETMLARGLHPIPVFHRGTPMHELSRLAANYKHIALGGVAKDRSGQESLRGWFDECWAVLRNHWPIRVHVFGVTAQWVLERYPFSSADSSSVITGAGMGRVMSFVDGRLDGGIDWREYGISKMDGAVMDSVGRTGDKSQSAHLSRGRYGVYAIRACERYLTDMWAARGVTWC